MAATSRTDSARAAIHQARVTRRDDLGAGGFRLHLHQEELADSFRPGQFVGVRVGEPGSFDPLLRRPFSVMRSSGRSRAEPGALVELLGVVVGRGTAAMSRYEVGQEVELLGPLGNSFFDEDLIPAAEERIVIAAGGVGVAPFFAVVDWLAEEGRLGDVTFAFGGRTEALLVARDALEELREQGMRLELATDDGSVGYHGRITGRLREILAEQGTPTVVLCCGPEPMMEATAAVARDASARCLVSLENQMPCGMGACYGCVVHQPARDGRPERHARACVEGPIFPADLLGW